MHYENITSDAQLRDFCSKSRDAQWIAFDTEFVSEHTYRPQLCLLQIAADDHLAILDPLSIQDVKPFWTFVSEGTHRSLVHAGREEFLFCSRSISRRPQKLFDVQIAAGLVGLEYPASYGNLISKLLGKKLAKGETRTDWRRRPLSQSQLEYALLDVVYLQPLREILQERLERMGRAGWMKDEMNAWQNHVEAHEHQERWRRVSGISGLSSRSLAIVRELSRWRERAAADRDRPAKRILRDDLVVEMARRATADPKQVRSIRGMERGDIHKQLPKITEAIERGLTLPQEDCPRLRRGRTPKQLNLLGQFLSSALTSICRQAEISPAIVGTAQDVRDLIAYRLRMDGAPPEPPILAQGWRAEIVGNRIEQLISGELSMRVCDPLADDPLVFEPTDR